MSASPADRRTASDDPTVDTTSFQHSPGRDVHRPDISNQEDHMFHRPVSVRLRVSALLITAVSVLGACSSSNKTHTTTTTTKPATATTAKATTATTAPTATTAKAT